MCRNNFCRLTMKLGYDLLALKNNNFCSYFFMCWHIFSVVSFLFLRLMCLVSERYIFKYIPRLQHFYGFTLTVFFVLFYGWIIQYFVLLLGLQFSFFIWYMYINSNIQSVLLSVMIFLLYSHVNTADVWKKFTAHDTWASLRGKKCAQCVFWSDFSLFKRRKTFFHIEFP